MVLVWIVQRLHNHNLKLTVHTKLGNFPSVFSINVGGGGELLHYQFITLLFLVKRIEVVIEIVVSFRMLSI